MSRLRELGFNAFKCPRKVIELQRRHLGGQAVFLSHQNQLQRDQKDTDFEREFVGESFDEYRYEK